MATAITNKDGILFPSNLQILIRKQGEPIVRTTEGKELVPDTIYTVTVGSFIARGGDGHEIFLSYKQKMDTYIRTSDALKTYVEDNKIVFPDSEAHLSNETRRK